MKQKKLLVEIGMGLVPITVKKLEKTITKLYQN